LRATHRFCPNCGKPVEAGAAPPVGTGGPSLQVAAGPSVDLRENRRLVTVLFGDLSGSTTLGERLDPEDLRRILTSYFSLLSREIQRYGGTVDKYIGDAVMAVFGAPVAHEDDAIRAVSSAVAMLSALDSLNTELEQRHGTRLALRIGINTGEVVAGLMAGDVQGAYTVVGDTVNTAQRFEAAAQPGTILVSQATRELARRAFEFEALPPLVLKGKVEPQPAFRVLGARYESAQSAGMPLVGRELELGQLREAFEDARRGDGGFVHIVGDAGIGKSRLVAELASGLPSQVLHIAARCVSFEVERPYALLARLLRVSLRVANGEDEALAKVSIDRVLRIVDRAVDPLDTALVLEVLGYGERSALDPLSRQRVLLRLLRRVLAAYARRAPLLIVAEDLHWADPASVALLGQLARDLPDRRCLLLSTSRHGALPPWDATIIALDALPQEGARALVEAAFGVPVDNTLAETILERTGGNPFFIEEVARGLTESAVLVQKDGRVAARPGFTPRVPATVQEVLEARLDRLAPRPKHVLQIAAVCGRIFRRRVVHHLVPRSGVGESLDALERESFIHAVAQAVQPDPTYVFRHALIQEVAYNGQLQTQRRTTHATIGAALETIYADRLDEMVGDLAFHYGHSDSIDKARYWLVRAGDRARALYANTEALVQYRAALQHAADGPGGLDAAAILERMGEVQTLIGRYDDAAESFQLALTRATVAAGPFVARLRRRLGTAFLHKGAYADTAAALDAALAALPDENDPEAARIELQVGRLHYQRGEFERARAALQLAVELGTRLGIDDLVAEGLKELGNVAVDTGDLQAAAEHYQGSQALYERLEDLLGLADIHSNLGIIDRRTGRYDLALQEYEAALALRERMGHLLGIGTCYNNIGEVHRTQGDFERAIPAYLQAIETWGSIGNAARVALALVGLGAARTESGDTGRGRADLLEAEERFAALGSTLYLPDLYRYLASADLAEGDLEAASRAAERSLEFARASQARHQEAATMRVLGQIMLSRGEVEGARALLELSRQALANLGDTLELARTEAVLRLLD
jgi:class 3 adenylate cyclase/tetratricopeptide (TPR) repeat protein